MGVPAGWYSTPQGNLRYWDGTAWTRHVAQAPTRQAVADQARPAAVSGDTAPARGEPARAVVASWLGWGGLGLAALVGAASSGVSGLFTLGGTYLLVVALIALVRGRVGWAQLRTRVAGGAALGAAVALTLVGGATAGPPDPTPADAPSASTASTPSASRSATSTRSPTSAPTITTATPTPSTTIPGNAAKGTALAAVAGLSVKWRAPKSGYERDQFGQAWFDTDRNGCDTRNDMLRRDLVERDMKNTCKVLAGTRDPDPYTGRRIRFVAGGDSEIDIDHVVALSDAWQKGAASWAAGKRLAFANDPVNLLAVDAGANRAKGDGDVATWLPANKSYRCEYVARVVSVKAKYQVWVTPAERDAMVRVLSSCPSTALPDPGPAPTTAALPKTAPEPAPSPPPAAEPETPSSVSYENCDAVRAAGAAPLLAGQPGCSSKLDRDGDGRACEP